MPNLRRVVVAWNGQTGLPGASVLYTADPDDATAALGTFFNAIKGGFPSPLTWTIPSTGDLVDSASGQLQGTWTGGTSATVAASSVGAYAAGVGAYLRWETGWIRNGRRVRGRTFLTGISTGLYDSSGTIDNANLASFQTAANALVANGHLVVWHRPTKKAPGTGGYHAIIAATMPDRVTSLRSRRV